MHRWWSVILVGCAATFAFAFLRQSSVALLGFPLDDAWIHLVYARNLIEGHGLAYNPGQLETGLTSPLWTLLIAPLLAIAGDYHAVAIKTLGAALHIATAWFGARLLLILGVLPVIARLAGLAIALDPYGMLAALSGMEVPLCACLLVWSLLGMGAGRNAEVLVALGLLPLSRPEAVLATSILWVMVVRARWKKGSTSGRAALVIVPWLPLVVWFGYCATVTGYPLPSTFYAKAAPSLSAWIHNAQWVPLVLEEIGILHLGLAGCLLGFGLVTTWSAEGGGPSVPRALVIALVAYLAAVFVSQPMKEATFYWMRYLLPAYPLAILIAAYGCEIWLRRSPIRSRSRRLLFALVVSAVPIGWFITVPRAIAHYTGSCQNVADSHMPVAHWLRDHTQPGEWIATHDAGVIRFMSERLVLDLAGLNNHRIVHGGLTAELARTQPRYFAVFPAWFPIVQRDARFTRVFFARAEHYVISSAPQDELVVYRFDPSH